MIVRLKLKVMFDDVGDGKAHVEADVADGQAHVDDSETQVEGNVDDDYDVDFHFDECFGVHVDANVAAISIQMQMWRVLVSLMLN